MRHGEPLVVGAAADKGIVYEAERGTFRVTSEPSQASRHDETNPALAAALARVDDPTLPKPLGIFYCAERTDYTTALGEHVPYRPLTREAFGKVLYEGSWRA